MISLKPVNTHNSFIGIKTKRKTDDKDFKQIKNLLKIIKEFYKDSLTNNKKEEISTYISNLISPEIEDIYLSSINQCLIFPFNKKLTNEDFFSLLLCSIFISIHQTSKQLNDKKKIFLSFLPLSSISDILEDNPLSSLKRDVLLANLSCLDPKQKLECSIFKVKEYHNYFNVFNDYQNKTNKTSISQTKFDSTKQLDDMYESDGQSNEETYINKLLLSYPIYDRHYLSKIILSDIVVSCYKEVLKTQNININNSKIKTILSSFLNNVNIYYLNLEDYGLTINEGTIFINEKHIHDSLINLSSAGCVILTVMHEIMHCLLRLVRNDDNFYYLTGKVKINNKIYDDSGKIFEKIFLNTEYKSINDSAGEFLINVDNYNSSLKIFQDELKKKNYKKDGSNKCSIAREEGIRMGVICGSFARHY